jgi:FixJ family two-component response regulator
MAKMALMIVTSRPEDVEELTALLQDSPWELTAVPRLEDAPGALRAARAPILLFDRDAAASWQDEIGRLARSRRNACVVLLSNVADQYLWDEVVQQGGFDLLPRPFQKQQVLSTLVFAHAYCKAPSPKTAN